MTTELSAFRIAIAQYPIEFHADFAAYADKVERWVAEAAGNDAKLLVFPEYGSMELTSLLPPQIREDLQAALDAINQYWDGFNQLYAKLANRYQVHILAPSFPYQRRNVAAFYSPEGRIGMQEKNILTRCERDEWKMKPGRGIQVFDTVLGKIGVTICYDSEFPLITRTMTEQGAILILVPSCTESLAGYYRVRIGSQARALENQCYVAQSPTVGEAPWAPATDINVGAAALYGPPDRSFPSTGVIAEGVIDSAGWVYGEVIPKKIATVRQDGDVLNYQHWQEQLLGNR
jgi:predicted amidohydrolase